jgi:hypothetical protein
VQWCRTFSVSLFRRFVVFAFTSFTNTQFLGTWILSMEKGSGRRAQDQVNKGVSKHSDMFIGYKLLYRQSVIGWHVVLMQNPPISPQSWLFRFHSMQFSQDFSIVELTFWPLGTHSAITLPLILKETTSIALNF